MDTLSLILHVTAAAVFVGPQVLMFFAVVPATWFIENDERLKRAVVSTIAKRFGTISGIALVTLLLTGIYQYTRVPEEIRQSSEYPFPMIFGVKMGLLLLLIVLMGIHGFRFARRINALSDDVIAGRGGADELARARLRSFSFSIVILVVSLLIMWAGVALGHHEFSWAIRDGA